MPFLFFEYGDGSFHVKIFRTAVDKAIYERTIKLTNGQSELEELSRFIANRKSHIKTTIFQCYKRTCEKGGLPGKWEKTRPVIEFGDNATSSMLIDGSGYYLDDPDNHVQYFVDMKTGK